MQLLRGRIRSLQPSVSSGPEKAFISAQLLASETLTVVRRRSAGDHHGGAEARTEADFGINLHPRLGVFAVFGQTR